MLIVHNSNRNPLKSTENTMKDSDNSVSCMKVNSVDVDAENWTVKPITNRKGEPKTVRLGNERKRDVYAEIRSTAGGISMSSTADVSTVRVDTGHSGPTSRLCYKWEAGGQINASVAYKTSQDAKKFRQFSEEDYCAASLNPNYTLGKYTTLHRVIISSLMKISLSTSTTISVEVGTPEKEKEHAEFSSKYQGCQKKCYSWVIYG